MDIIDNLNAGFRIDAYQAPSTEAEIAELIKLSAVPVPEDYLDVIRKINCPEILITKIQYIRIWGAERAVEMNDAYEIQKYIPVSLAIGDDEGGSVLILMDGARGFGLYTAGFGDLDLESAVFIAPTLSDLLINGIGVDAL